MNIKTSLVEITWLEGMPHGYGCGYIGIPPEHPWFNKTGEEIQELISVHGGVTWCASYAPRQKFDGYKWIGFDTAHFGDDEFNCNKSFCEREIESMKQQALDAV